MAKSIMAEKCDFEEKEYEIPLYAQLLSGTDKIWSPRQVFEGKFGIDAALKANNLLFWNLFGLKSIPIGIILNDYNWGFVWRKLHKKRALPNFEINLLIQTKTPRYYNGTNAHYYNLGIKKHYWQISLTGHQQNILLKVEKKLKTKLLVLYAASVFHKYDELYYHINNSTLINNSTFVKPSNLDNHSKWVYDTPGSVGIACSEPKKIADKEIFELIDNQLEQRTTIQNIDDSIYLLDLDKAITLTVQEINNEKNPLIAEILRRYSLLEELLGNNEEIYLRAYLRIILFFDLLNVRWYIIG